MKNAPIFVLGVVVLVLGFLLYKKTQSCVGQNFFGKAHATHQRKDHKGNTVNTLECEYLVGKNGDVCIMPISYLQSMEAGTRPDTAIEVRHKETIVWYGDHGESIVVQQMAGVDCSNHSQPDNPPYGSGPFLVDITSVTPNLTYAHITDNPKNEGYCYKNNINVTVNGRTTSIDPHEFGQPDTP